MSAFRQSIGWLFVLISWAIEFYFGRTTEVTNIMATATYRNLSLMHLLYKQVDMAPLALFRMFMGILLSVEGFGAILTGWVRENYVDVPFTFSFIGFDFLQILVGPQAYVVYFMLGVLGAMIAAGWHYKLASIGYALLWSAVYLGQKTSYNNHYYLMMLLTCVLVVMPMHRYLSLDVSQGRVPAQQTTHQWHVLFFKWLLLVVYTYAAIAKLNADWLSGAALRAILAGKQSYWLIGPLFGKHWFVLFLAYGGIMFDFLIIPALWWGKSRKFAFALALFFHIFNSIVFQIGIFPYMMIASSLLFFDSEAVRKLFVRKDPILTTTLEVKPPPLLWRTMTKITLLLFFIVMILLPLRHWMYKGDVNWTEEGHRLSWRMMLRVKSGASTFKVVSEAAGMNKLIVPEDYMPYDMARRMAGHPDMLWQFAQRLKRQYQELGYTDTKVYADVWVSLNGRPKQRYIDPNADLANEPWHHFKHHWWILEENKE